MNTLKTKILKSFSFNCLILVCFGFIFSTNCVAQNTYSKRYFYGLDVLQLIDGAPDGGNYFCGRSYAGKAILGKIDSVGNLEWAKVIGDTMGATPETMSCLKNGNVVVALTIGSAGPVTLRTWVVCFDVFGNWVFTKKYSGTAPINVTNNMISDDEGFTMTIYDGQLNRTHLLKMDSLGDHLISCDIDNSDWAVMKTWQGDYKLYRMFGEAIISLDSNFQFTYALSNIIQPPPIGYGMVQVNDSSFIVYGGPAGFVGLVDSLGFMIWTKRILVPHKITSAHLTDSNSVLLIAQGGYCGNQCSYIFLINLDLQGNILSSKVIYDQGINIDYQRSKASFRNNRLSYTWIERKNSNIHSTSFLINSTDTTFTNLCSAIDTVISSYAPGFSPSWFGYSCISNNDSLLNDSITINNILFPYADCNDSTLIGIVEPDRLASFLIYPNPGQSKTTCVFPSLLSNADINIYSMEGNLVFTKKKISSSSLTIEINDLSKGVYLIEVIEDTYVSRKKFVKN